MGEAIQSFVNDALGIVEGAFGVSPKEMAIQILSTLVLFLIVRFFFWNKVTDYLEGRKEAMAQEYNDAQNAKDEAKGLREEADAELTMIKMKSKSAYSSNTFIDVGVVIAKPFLPVISFGKFR